jgi:hypothetical protein
MSRTRATSSWCGRGPGSGRHGARTAARRRPACTAITSGRWGRPRRRPPGDGAGQGRQDALLGPGLCPRQTFREQVLGVLDRYQRRIPRLTGQAGAVARELAGRGAAAGAAGRPSLPAHRAASPAPACPARRPDARHPGRRSIPMTTRCAAAAAIHRAHQRRDRRARGCPARPHG